MNTFQKSTAFHRILSRHARQAVKVSHHTALVGRSLFLRFHKLIPQLPLVKYAGIIIFLLSYYSLEPTFVGLLHCLYRTAKGYLLRPLQFINASNP